MYERRRRRSIFDLMSEYMEEFESLADELVGLAFPERPSWDTESCCLEPLCNVFVTPNEVVITADLPNTEPATLKVEAMGEDLIEITAKLKRKMRFDDFGITHREGEFSLLRCQTRMPVPVDTKRMRISFKRGILEIRLPRKRGYEIKVK
ncbi:MAG: Hsp20/alpha crystallin family protein [Candidatus Bathyarchaeaceae archaeon]